MAVSADGLTARLAVTFPTTRPVTWWVVLTTADGRTGRTPQRLLEKNCGT
ncbi:hypothetical protein [Catellatospora sp. NPDC049609]